MTGVNSDQVKEFHASRLQTILLLTLGVAILAWSGTMLMLGDLPAWASAMAILFAVGAGFALPVLIYRLIMRPIMVRVSSDGLFLKNYNATIPWDALERAELINTRGDSGEVVEFIPATPLHSVFKSGKLALGASANSMAKLPDYCFSMTGIDGSNQDLLAAILIHLPDDAER